MPWKCIWHGVSETKKFSIRNIFVYKIILKKRKNCVCVQERSKCIIGSKNQIVIF